MNTTHSGQFRGLVRSCLEGDEASWDRLIETITPTVLSVCQEMRCSKEECLDVFGQVCSLLLHNLHRLKKPDRILQYVAAVARREVLASIRRAKLFENYRVSEHIDCAQNLTTKPDESAERSEQREILTRAILNMSERESRLIYFLFLDANEPTYEEIGERLGMPVSSIGPTRARCLLKLRRLLRQADLRP